MFSLITLICKSDDDEDVIIDDGRWLDLCSDNLVSAIRVYIGAILGICRYYSGHLSGLSQTHLAIGYSLLGYSHVALPVRLLQSEFSLRTCTPSTHLHHACPHVHTYITHTVVSFIAPFSFITWSAPFLENSRKGASVHSTCICLYLSLQDWLASTGLPPHPGPNPNFSTFKIFSQNVTSLETYLPKVLEQDFDVCFLQEVSATQLSLGGLHGTIKSSKHKAILTATDPELTMTGGVGTMFKQHVKAIKLMPTTVALSSMTGNGRFQIVALFLPSNITITVVNIYGWTNGHTNHAAAARADTLYYCYHC